MSHIRPISDLRNKFTEVSRIVHESGEPVVLTKNGYGNMVVLSYEAYEQMRHETGIALSLREAERQAEQTDQRHNHEEVMSGLRAILHEAEPDHDL